MRTDRTKWCKGSQTVPSEKSRRIPYQNRTVAMKKSTAEAYRGYTPSIRYSEEDGCFIGEVAGLNLHDISFEGENEEEIRKDFERAIDFYLATKENPEQPFAGRITLHVTPEMHAELFSKAKNAGADSLDAWLVRELKASVLQHA
jgi:predicted HicB family RNase H-like nuclease